MDCDLKIPAPWKCKMVEPIHLIPREQREKVLEEAGYNMFNIPSEDVFIDLITDSGTGAMSEHQWSQMLLGDEAYAGSPSFFRMQKAVQDIVGMPHVLPTHQGRAAENVLHSVLVKEGSIIPGNSHFDTTKAHIEWRKARAIDCTIDECFDMKSRHPFKGNIDLAKLDKVVSEHGLDKIGFVCITVTNNLGGGQPVSLENIRAVCKYCREKGIITIVDAARFAENAWFIKRREPGQSHRSIRDIVRDMFEMADGATMSSKKDAIVNIGGFLALRDPVIHEKCMQYSILCEGFLTYGGLSGRDMEAIAQGLHEGCDEAYLTARIEQVCKLGESLDEAGIPVIMPIGGHAVYVECKQLLPHIPQEQFPAQALVVELYRRFGVRSVEIGTVLADRDPVTHKNRCPKLELVRLAIPRRVYTDDHLEYVKEAIVRIAKDKESISGLEFTYEPELLRHFRARFKKVDASSAASTVSL